MIVTTQEYNPEEIRFLEAVEKAAQKYRKSQFVAEIPAEEVEKSLKEGYCVADYYPGGIWEGIDNGESFSKDLIEELNKRETLYIDMERTFYNSVTGS